ncbi:MAG: cytochrome c oxidase subunit 3 [Bacteroidetes bacterium]|nr:cytochrome c oxidase subunit 3 [Bacteroidota bacterium]
MNPAIILERKTAWRGGVSPFNVSFGKLFMWFFLVSDALTFAGILTAYGFLRHKYAHVWPVSGDIFVHFPFTHAHLPLAYVGLMTFILIMSSVTMVLAVEAGHRMNKKGVVLWLGLTILGGFFFLLSQVWEWSVFITGTSGGTAVDIFKDGRWVKEIFHGANLIRNEYGHPLYGDFFFFITGFHGFHVFSGVVINIITLKMAVKNVFAKRGHYEWVEKTGLYWHFVDLVWVFVFTFFYLL